MLQAKVKIVNNSDNPVYTNGDPDWDDQQFYVNGKYIRNIHSYELKVGESAEVTVGYPDSLTSDKKPDPSNEKPDPNVLGIDFTSQKGGEGPGYYSVMGQNSKGLFTFTGPSGKEENPPFKLSVSDQTFWTCTVTIENR